MFLNVVGHANGLGPTRLLDSLHLSPFVLCLLGIILGPEGGVNQIEVNIVESHRFQRGREGLFDGLALPGRALGGDKQVLTRNLGLFDCSTEFLLVSIGFGVLLACPSVRLRWRTCVRTLGSIEVVEARLDSSHGDFHDILVEPFAGTTRLVVGCAQAISDLLKSVELSIPRGSVGKSKDIIILPLESGGHHSA